MNRPAYIEVTPPLVPLHNSLLYYLSTSWSYACDSTTKITPQSPVPNKAGLYQGPIPVCHRKELVTCGQTQKHLPGEIEKFTDHKRNYYGVYGAEKLGPFIITFNHGENKSELGSYVGNYMYRTTVGKVRNDCYSGVVNGVYQDCSDSYNAFISSSVGTEFHLRDRGPIIWPKYGYTDKWGSKISWGLRHPTSFSEGNYIYVFYLDTGNSRVGVRTGTQGLDSGISVARSKKTSLGRPGSWQVWTGRDWRAALPAGFNQRRIHNFYSKRGGPSLPILGRNNNTYFFSVAKYADHKYVGVEYYVDTAIPNVKATFSVALRFSNDLLHWSRRYEVTSLRSEGNDAGDAFNKSIFRYPRFLNKDGTSQSHIDLKNFCLIGWSGSEILLQRLSL